MAERIGFIRDDFTGGVEPYIVDNLDDSGQGSLRYGASLGGRFITAAPGLAGDLLLPSEIPVAADTLLALEAAVLLKHTGVLHHGLRITGPNVGIAYTRLDGQYTTPEIDAEGSDGIHIDATATDLIWVHHNNIDDWADGGVDTETDTDPGTIDRIAITWNKFHATRQLLNLWATRVSVGFNRIADCWTRAPKITNGNAHSYNNLIKRWNHPSIHQTASGAGLLSDYDMFIVGTAAPLNSSKVNTFDGPIQTNNHKHFGATPIQLQAGPSNVDPAFITAARAISGYQTPITSNDWSALRQLVENETGV